MNLVSDPLGLLLLLLLLLLKMQLLLLRKHRMLPVLLVHRLLLLILHLRARRLVHNSSLALKLMPRRKMGTRGAKLRACTGVLAESCKAVVDARLRATRISEGSV
jgi:hypothetical protein